MSLVSRSKSFSYHGGTFSSGGSSGHGTFLFSRNKLPPMPGSLSRSCSRGSGKYSFLGQGFDSPRPQNDQKEKNSSGNGAETPPKINPNKTTSTIQGLQAGLKGTIAIIQQEIEISQAELNNQQASKALHLKLKTLEYQLSRLESLEEEYILQTRLRDGVRSMAQAYALQPTPNTKLALQNVKAGFRECTHALTALEAHLPEFMGAFHMKMKGVQGFARLCPGDVYEITLKHGNQKWRTRTKVRSDLGQDWDFPEAKVRALLAQDLIIKAKEVKTLGKQVLLGNKYCDITELFSSHPQLMTVNLNPSGSLKLSILVEWDPLAQFYEEPLTVKSPLNGNLPQLPLPPKRRMLSSPLSNGGLLLRGSLKSSQREFTPSPVSSPSPPLPKEDETRKDLGGNILQLANRFEEIQGQFPDLEGIEMTIAGLRRIVLLQEGDSYFKEGTSSRIGSLRVVQSPSNTSLTLIRSALEAFSFLENEEDEDSKASMSPEPIQDRPRSYKAQTSLAGKDKGKRKKDGDSGVSSLSSASSRSQASASPEGEEQEGRVLRTISDTVTVTGSEELDLVLNTHVSSCLHHVKNLGSFGPLCWREGRALTKLQEEGRILSLILTRIEDPYQEGTHRLLPEGTPYVKQLWGNITKSSSESFTLIASGDEVAKAMEGEIRGFPGYSATALSKLMVQGMLDEGQTEIDSQPRNYDHGHSHDEWGMDLVTAFQFFSYLKAIDGEEAFLSLFTEIEEEDRVVSMLSSTRDLDSLQDPLLTLGPSSVPSLPVFTAMANLLFHKKPEVREEMTRFILEMGRQRRTEVLSQTLVILEAPSASTRRVGLEVISLLGGEECRAEVAFLCQTDPDPSVRDSARRTLLLLSDGDEEGKRIIAQLTLNSHGFQGLLN